MQVSRLEVNLGDIINILACIDVVINKFTFVDNLSEEQKSSLVELSILRSKLLKFAGME